MGRRYLIALALMSCSSWQSNASRHYHIEIDPTFTPDQANTIMDAATHWQNKSNAYVSFDGADAWNESDVITFVATSLDTMQKEFGGGTIGMAEYEGQSSQITIVETLTGDLLHQTAEHEIGHAIGLVHTGTGTLMCQNESCAAIDVTCADLAQLEGHVAPSCE